MSTFTETLVHGNERSFKSATLTPMQKLTLQYVVFGLVYYGFVAIEGMLMRTQLVDPNLMPADQYYGILTAHPLVGIFGSSYLLVFGAFTFLIPYLMKKPLWSFKMAKWTLWLIVIGVFTFWFDGFLTRYAPAYTLYWPLPADFNQFKPVSGAIFITGIALVMVGTALYVLNIFKTITYTPAGWTRQPAGALLGDALGLTSIKRLFQGKLHRDREQDHLVSLPVAAIARGSVDVAFNVVIIVSNHQNRWDCGRMRLRHYYNNQLVF